MSRSISLVILVCCACSIHTASLVQPVTNQSANRTNLLLSTASSVPSATSPRKLSMVDHTLIVHLISSQVNSHSASLHKSSQSNSQSNQLGTANSTNASDQFQNNPALSCADGQTYWDPIESQCVNCSSSCPTGAYVSRVCNRTHDLECQCHKGSYMSVMDKTCKPCAECPFGWGVWRTCRWSRNTVCRKCQPGTYSGASVGTLGCIPCSKCGPNQEMISECDGNRDTVCVDRMALRANFSLYFPSFSAQRNGILPNGPSSQLIGNDEFEDEDRSSYPEATIYSSPQSVHNYALPFYFAILVVIVFAICIYALVQLRCSEVINGRSGMLTTQADHKHMMFNQTGGMLTPKVVATGALPYTMPSPYYHHQASIQPVWSYENDYPLANQQYSTVMHLYTSSQRCKAPGRVELSEGVIRNGSSGSSKSRPKYKAYYELLYAPNEMPQCNEPLLTNGQQNLTTDMIEALERRLASDSISWRMLARELGFNDKQIGEFETKSTTLQTTDSTVPQQTTVTVDTAKVTRLLLTDWWQIVDTSEDSTAPTHERSLQNEQPQVVASKADSVAVLVKALTRIGRVDCARLVQNHHKKASPSPSPSTLSSSCSLSQDR